jgi:hypothetical protein
LPFATGECVGKPLVPVGGGIDMTNAVAVAQFGRQKGSPTKA